MADSVRSWPAAARLARAIAGGFGCERAPRAQGTVASAAATLVAAGLLAIAPVLLPLFAVLALIAGLWAIRRLGVRDDPGWVVIDEIAGQWIALLGAIGGGPLLLIAGFVLFRAFDIFKPGPIRWAERLPGAIGVMADDVLAGAAAALVLLAARLALAPLSRPDCPGPRAWLYPANPLVPDSSVGRASGC